MAERVRAVAAPSRSLSAARRVAIARAASAITLYPRDADDAEALLQHADVAMYRGQARAAGAACGALRERPGRTLPRPAPTPPPPDQPPAPAAALDASCGEAGCARVYQPIVDLDDGAVVGYEALARGPEGSPLERPDQLFATARRAADRLGELDWACRAAAVDGALEAGPLGAAQPVRQRRARALGTPVPEAPAPSYASARRASSTSSLEITERALTDRPADLLHARRRASATRGWGIALDDVGADVRSLALMPLLRPDVIKLDLRLVQDQPTTEIAEIVNAVNAERERTGAVVLAEGIETEEHLETARAHGRDARPGLALRPPRRRSSRPRRPGPAARRRCRGRASAAARSPYEVVRRGRDVRRGRQAAAARDLACSSSTRPPRSATAR